MNHQVGNKMFIVPATEAANVEGTVSAEQESAEVAWAYSLKQ